jgi:mannose-1-phosphate guanylyltransferase
VSGDLDGFRLPGQEVKPGIFCGLNCSIDFDTVEIVPPVLIGGSVRIESGCRIVGPTMIGPGSIIEANAEVSSCIIDSYTRINGVATLEDKIIFGNHCITPDGHSIKISDHDIGWILGDVREQGPPNPVHEALSGLADELRGN